VNFEIPPELEEIGGRVATFVRDEVLPVEASAGPEDFDSVLSELRTKARSAGLWTPHLPQERGGMGLGALGMALVSEELGVSALASLALNVMAPDEGTMHLLLEAGRPDQLDRYLKPLAAGDVRSCFAMSEKEVASSDPSGLRTRAVQDGADWVIDGEKWFVSGAAGAAFAVVVAMTDPDDEKPHRRYSLFIVDADNPGWRVVREIPVMGSQGPGGHCEVRLERCRVPGDAMLGERGRGFALSQRRLGMGRIGHAMRWIGVSQRALDLAAERAIAREAFGRRLAEHEAVQWMLADSAIELHAARLMVLHAAWKIDRGLEHRQEISMVKVFVAEALGRIVDRALQVHGALGISMEAPLARMYEDARAARIYDGPSEVHRMVIARALLRSYLERGTTKRGLG
jgi:alkylation response protein AidB-like acyl-CoA dehydrogenase